MQVGDYYQNKIYVNGVEQSLSQQYSSQYTPYTNFNSGNGRIGGWRLDNNYQQVMDLAIFKIHNKSITHHPRQKKDLKRNLKKTKFVGIDFFPVDSNRS
jgi:hypothetical protein